MSDRCPCGGIILADTEDWKTPLCDNCFFSQAGDMVGKLQQENAEAKKLIADLKGGLEKLEKYVAYNGDTWVQKTARETLEKNSEALKRWE